MIYTYKSLIVTVDSKRKLGNTMKKILILLIASILSLFGGTFNVSTTPELRTALSTAATNGEDDTIIIADGTYKTTDDGQGTFSYLGNEDNNLTLQGSSAENVILSGDNQHQIFNHKSTENAPMTLEKLSFVDGNKTSEVGGGVYTDYSIEVKDCNFTNNTTSRIGGGFFSHYSATVTNSTFTNNSATKEGGGFYSNSATVTNSTFTNNSANSGGGFWSYSATVTNSTFTNNSAVDYGGGGFYSNGDTVTATNSTFTNNSATEECGGFYSAGDSATITNSTFTNNSASSGGGFRSDKATITNSTFTNNSTTNQGGGFRSYSVTVTNSTFTNNSNAIYIPTGEKNIIINSIFVDNNISDINGSSNAIISKLENNYLDTSKLTISNFKKNNIFDGVNLGFVDITNGDYRLTESSGLIDKGISTITGITLPATDLDGNARIVGGGIDIGPYEFSTTKPTITAFTNIGTAKELAPLTFNVAYSLSSGRTLGNISYDYTNDASWTSLNTYTFSTAGTYTVNAKVTDSAGEYSVNSLQVTVAQLPFSEMTDEQKLIKAVNPIYYDAIVEIINKKSQVNTLTTNTISTLENSWSLIGSSTAITDLSIFSDASIIWTYVDGAWNAYSSNSTTRQKIIDANIPLITNIPANSGIWVNK